MPPASPPPPPTYVTLPRARHRCAWAGHSNLCVLLCVCVGVQTISVVHSARRRGLTEMLLPVFSGSATTDEPEVKRAPKDGPYHRQRILHPGLIEIDRKLFKILEVSGTIGSTN